MANKSLFLYILVYLFLFYDAVFDLLSHEILLLVVLVLLAAELHNRLLSGFEVLALNFHCFVLVD